MAKERRPRRTQGTTTKFGLTSLTGGGEVKGYMITGNYDDGRLCEVFLKIAKQGGTLHGFADGLAITISHALQNGTPVVEICKGLVGMRFEPTGPTTDPDIPEALSICDYIGRRLALDYCTPEERETHGLNGGHSRSGLDA